MLGDERKTHEFIGHAENKHSDYTARTVTDAQL